MKAETPFQFIWDSSSVSEVWEEIVEGIGSLFSFYFLLEDFTIVLFEERSVDVDVLVWSWADVVDEVESVIDAVVRVHRYDQY